VLEQALLAAQNPSRESPSGSDQVTLPGNDNGFR
jgi:hypothetical protein